MATKEKCAICGGTKTFGEGDCAYGCYWELEGWAGWNAREKKMYFTCSQALVLASKHRQTYRNMVKTARSLGWAGRENYKLTMVPVIAPVVTFTPAKERVAAKKWTGMGWWAFDSTTTRTIEVL